MQSAYSQYKNLKRIVRDEAATDIQRVFRGMRVRVAVGFVIRKTAVMETTASTISTFGGDRTYSPSPRRQLQPQERGQATNTLSSFSPTRHTRPRDDVDETEERHQSARRDEGALIGVSSIDLASTNDSTSTFELASPSKRKILIKSKTTGDHHQHQQQQEGSPPHISTIAMSPTARRAFGSSDTFDLTSASFDHADTTPAPPVVVGGSVGSAETGTLSAQHQQRKRKGADVRSPSSTSSVVEWWQSPVALSLKSDYRDLLAQKNSLKSLLKRFDDEFKSMHGRLPIRKEKEVFVYVSYSNIIIYSSFLISPFPICPENAIYL